MSVLAQIVRRRNAMADVLSLILHAIIAGLEPGLKTTVRLFGLGLEMAAIAGAKATTSIVIEKPSYA